MAYFLIKKGEYDDINFDLINKNKIHGVFGTTTGSTKQETKTITDETYTDYKYKYYVYVKNFNPNELSTIYYKYDYTVDLNFEYKYTTPFTEPHILIDYAVEEVKINSVSVGAGKYERTLMDRVVQNIQEWKNFLGDHMNNNPNYKFEAAFGSEVIGAVTGDLNVGTQITKSSKTYYPAVQLTTSDYTIDESNMIIKIHKTLNIRHPDDSIIPDSEPFEQSLGSLNNNAGLIKHIPKYFRVRITAKPYEQYSTVWQVGDTSKNAFEFQDNTLISPNAKHGEIPLTKHIGETIINANTNGKQTIEFKHTGNQNIQNGDTFTIDDIWGNLIGREFRVVSVKYSGVINPEKTIYAREV